MIGRLSAPTSVRIGGGARRPRGILHRAPQRHQAEIHQEQDQHRGQPRIPFPIGAPHRPAPQRAGDQREKGEGGADRGGRFRRDIGERMPPHQRAQRGKAHHAPDEHRQPRIRHVDEHDLHGGALLIVVGRHRRLIEADQQQDRGRARQPRQHARRQRQELGRDWRDRSASWHPDSRQRRGRQCGLVCFIWPPRELIGVKSFSHVSPDRGAGSPRPRTVRSRG